MWKLTIVQWYIQQYLGMPHQDYLCKPWKEIVVPIERLVDTYNLFQDLYGKEVIDIKEIHDDN